MKTFSSILLLSILLLVSTKLSSNNFLVNGRGHLRTEFRTTTPFSKIDSRIKANIKIIKSKIRNISITAQENLVPLIDLTERNGILVISTGGYEFTSDSTINITIYVPVIDEICLSGSGTIYSECPAGSIKIPGNGVISCIGNTTQVSIEISGNGETNLQALKLKNCLVNITGNGIVHINASNKLEILIPGEGTVYYSGNPEIRSSITGDGQVIAKK
jgi:hypothetical protein